MNLDTFPATEPIFVDANIWTYFALNTEPFQASCTMFMYGIESGRITAAISDAVLNEVFYAILVGKASAELQTTKIKQIHRNLLTDQNLSAVCYQSCLGFTQYLDKLPQTNLKRLTVAYQIQVPSLKWEMAGVRG